MKVSEPFSAVRSHFCRGSNPGRPSLSSGKCLGLYVILLSKQLLNVCWKRESYPSVAFIQPGDTSFPFHRIIAISVTAVRKVEPSSFQLEFGAFFLSIMWSISAQTGHQQPKLKYAKYSTQKRKKKNTHTHTPQSTK